MCLTPLSWGQAAAGFPELPCIGKVKGAEDVELWRPYKVSERDRLYAEMTRERQTGDKQSRNANLRECVTPETALCPPR